MLDRYRSHWFFAGRGEPDEADVAEMYEFFYGPRDGRRLLLEHWAGELQTSTGGDSMLSRLRRLLLGPTRSEARARESALESKSAAVRQQMDNLLATGRAVEKSLALLSVSVMRLRAEREVYQTALKRIAAETGPTASIAATALEDAIRLPTLTVVDSFGKPDPRDADREGADDLMRATLYERRHGDGAFGD